MLPNPYPDLSSDGKVQESDLAHFLEDRKTFWRYLITPIVEFQNHFLMFIILNYRKCTGSFICYDCYDIITEGPILQPVTDPDTTTDYYGNMGCWVFKGGIQN